MKRRSNTQSQNVLLIYIVPELTCVFTCNSYVYSHTTHMCTHTVFSHVTRKQNIILLDTQATQTFQ